MAILYNQSAFYEPISGILYILKNNKLQPQAIHFADSEESMKTKQFPTTIKPQYIAPLVKHVEDFLATLKTLPTNSVALSLVDGQPQAGPFFITIKVSGANTPDPTFSLSQLSYDFNTDPVNMTLLKRTILDGLKNSGYQV